MKNNNRHISDYETDVEALLKALTPRSRAVVDRIRRDHRLSVTQIIRGAVDDTLQELERDIATRGKESGGENEWAFVRYVKRLEGEEPGRPWRWNHGSHKVGQVSFYSAFGGADVLRLVNTMGLPGSLRRAA